MADCSRPPHNQPRSVFGFRSKGAYDDVFVSRPKVRAPTIAPGVKDYAEIFNCSSSKPSSIPVLDLDEFHKSEADDEVLVDYGNVFGGFTDAKIGFAYEDVFSVAADGVSRRANDSHSHSGGTDRSTAVEYSQKLPHESLWEKKHSMSSGKTISGVEGDSDERYGLGRLSKGPVPASSFDETVSLKKASVRRSDTTTNNFKQDGDELPVGKPSSSVSSSGLPKHGGDRFIEIDNRSRNGSGSDKSISSDTQMETNIIRPKVQMSEAAAATDSSLHLGGSMSTYSDVYRHNAHREGHSGSNNSLEGMCVRSMHGLDKPFKKDDKEDESVVKRNAVTSNLSLDLTHEHGSGYGTPKLAAGNSTGLNSHGSVNAKDDIYRNSLRDVKFQVVNGSRGPSVKYSQPDASDATPHERSDSAPATQSQQSFRKMNIAIEGKENPEVTVSRDVGSGGTHKDSNGHLSNGGMSKNEVEHVGAAKIKTSTSKIDVSKRSTYLSASNSPCSSEDGIDKHSETSVSAAAVRKAIKEAQALINVAKESNGVKGFMSLAMARKSGQVKVAKEEHNSKVNENPKNFEAAPAKIQNNLSTSAADSATWPIGSEMKMTSADTVVERSNQGTEFSTFNKPDQMKAVEMQSSLRKKTQESASTLHALPKINSFQEKLAVYSSIMDQKLAPRTEDATLPGIVADSEKIRIFPEADCLIVPKKREAEVNSASQEVFLNKSPESPRKDAALLGIVAGYGQIRIVPKADCSIVPNVEKRETEVTSASEEAFHKNSPQSPRIEDVALPGIVAGSGHIRIVLEADCTIVPNVVKGETKANSADKEAFLNRSPESYTGAEKESQKAMNSRNRGSKMQSFHDDIVKQDAVAAAEHIDTDRNEAIKVESENHASSDLTSLEEENAEESELDPHDQVLDTEDTDSRDYASAEENWVPSDTDDEISEKDHHFSAEKNLGEIDEMENMVVSEVPVTSEDTLPPSLNNIHHGQIVKETDDVQLQNILMKEALVSDEKTAPVVNNSDENPVVEETDKNEDISLQITVKCDAATITSEEVTAAVLKEDLIVEEADGSENGALHNTMIHDHEVKFSSEKTTVPFFNYVDEDPIVEEADISEETSVLFIVSPRTKITSEDGASSCFNSANRDTGVEIEGTVDMTEQTMSNHEAIIISENDIAPFYDKSNEDQIVVGDGDDTTSEYSVGFQDNEHEDLSTEMLDCAARVETESAFCADPESLHLEGSEVELISTDDLAEESAADAIEESISMPSTFEPQYQERDDKNSRDPDRRAQQDQEELLDDAGLEADATEEDHETMNVRGSENNNVTVDAAGNEDATETESTSGDSKHVNSEPEAEVQLFEPLPDSIKHKETTEVEQLHENHVQQVERQERRKWDISRETFELPELETGAFDIQDTMKQDSNEIERQMDRHGRKKWEIPRENFELPVLGDEVVEENEENVGHDTEGAEGATQSPEKPERKKWKIQKQVFEVPILCAEAVQDTPYHEGFVIKTLSSEEMGMTHNSLNTVTLPEEMVRHEEVYDEFCTNAEAVPGDAASCELCSENAEEIAKESVPKIIMSSEKEPCKQMEETSSQQDGKVDEGKAVKQEDRMKGADDVNVKDEIKRTLGMLWKKIYNIKQDEASESVELTGKENVNVNDTIAHGITKDLNLKGPVQLVESPRKQDNTETLNFSGNRKGNEDSFESPEAFEVNESSIHKCSDSVSMETREVQRNTPLAFHSNKYQEGEKRSDCVENENYNANYPESQSEEALFGSESENCTETAPTHEVCDLKKEGIRTCNITPSNVYEHREMDSETVSRSNHLMVDESLVDNAESTHKTMVLQQDGLNDVPDDISDENLSEAEVEMHHVDDLSNKRCTDSEQHNTNTSRHNMKSVSESDAPDVTPSHGFEQMSDKKETCTDKIEQASNWKWIFGDELKDKSNKQDEASDLKKFGEVKGKTKETANNNDTSHISGKVKIDGDKPSLMDETVPNRLHKEVTPDQEVVKNLKRAKELEKIVVERAIREARERAFIEARERAAMERANAVARETSAKEKTNLESQERIALERANAQVRGREAADRAKADAHQKLDSDGRERSQRTSSEAKLSSERNSLEAKRKAELERAAVERATTEARQRALEKAMSRKEQVTESSSRSASTSSDEYGSASKERHNEDKPSESALRFKARNERHQRIAERAAKALAEKNMRDLLVQREQAERNRLAEVLDADVKRWARGKTGNLRALLSTLQYILGPDSGWQAIHLTEIVTADAVKKAYRKATLFVHPDKLQQRGATIRQKYICEKVFDLLKEAWNKFDRDER